MSGSRVSFLVASVFFVFAGVGCNCGPSIPVTSADPDAGVDAGEDSGPMLGRPEQCNGIDDDLDGWVDEGCPIRLTDSPLPDVAPSVDGTRVAWARLPQTGTSGQSEIWMLDVGPSAAREPRLIAEGGAPSLSGDRIAFLRDEGLWVANWRTGEETQIETVPATGIHRPQLEGNLLAYSLYVGDDNSDVYAHDLATGERWVLGEHPALQEFPRIERGSRRIAYRDDRHGHHTVHLLHLFDLFVADSPAAPIQRVTEREPEQLFSRVQAFDAGRLLTDETLGPIAPSMPDSCDPVIVDVDEGSFRRLERPGLPCFAAGDLRGQRAVLEYDPVGVSDLYLWLLETDELVQVTDHNRTSTTARLGDELLVWVDDRNDQWDLYMMDLSDMDTGDFLPEGVRR